MRITCPQCGFFRELPDHKVPVTSTMATCPKCRHRFRFRPDHTPTWQQEPRLIDLHGEAPAPDQEGTSSWRRGRDRKPQAAPEPESTATPETAPLADSEPPVQAEADVEEYREVPAPRRMPRLRAEVILPEPEPEPEPEPQAPPVPEPVAQAPEPEPEPAPAAAAIPTPPKAPEAAVAAVPETPVVPEAAAVPKAPIVTAPPVTREASAVPTPPAEPAAPAAREIPAAPETREPEADIPPPPEPPRRFAPRAETARRESAQTPADDAEPTPPSRPKRLDKDGVRDIWARLQAMDEPHASQTEEARDDRDEDDPRDDTPQETDPIPWERQDIYGFLPGLLLTLRQILRHPVAFFTAMPEGRPRSKALVFNLLISEFLLVIDFLWSLSGLRLHMGAPNQGELAGAMGSGNSLYFLVALLLVPPILAVGVFLDAWLTQLLLLLFRNARKNVSETFRVMCYSAAPMVLSAVPVAGQILSPLILVWYMALQAIGLRQLHQGGYTQILAAVFIKWSLYLFMVLAVLQGFAPQ